MSDKLTEFAEKIAGNYPVKKLVNVLKKKHSNKVIEKLSDINHVLEYIPDGKIKKFADHIGQRKLILNEIQFLTRCKSEWCVYAGSAPGNKTYFLSQLFPKIKFILIDPNKFDLVVNKTSHRKIKHKDIVHISSGYPTKSNKMPENASILDYIKKTNYKIYILEEYMTHELSRLFSELDCDFISDIRSNIYMRQYPTDFDIVWNTSMMFNWINIIKPNRSMLKIRMPYGTDNIKIKNDSYITEEFELSKKYGIDFMKNYKEHKFFMCVSEFYIQPWAGESSTELRMIIDKENLLNIVEYDIENIENKLYYYNNISRTWVCHNNPNANKSLGFCNCNDCALENKIWVDYGYNKKQVLDAVKYLGAVTNRPLIRTHRYPYYSKMSYSEMINRANSWVSSFKQKKLKINKGDFGKKKSGGVLKQSKTTRQSKTNRQSKKKSKKKNKTNRQSKKKSKKKNKTNRQIKKKSKKKSKKKTNRQSKKKMA